jgi:MFS family permease
VLYHIASDEARGLVEAPSGSLAGVRDRLGIPVLTGRWSLAAALVADSVGDGIFVPFSILYFLKTTTLRLPTIGLSLSIAGLLALPFVAVSGLLVDRFGSVRVTVAGNLLSALAFASYLAVTHAWQIIVFGLLAAGGSRLFWTANLALVGDAIAPGERARWFAFQRAARNLGFGLGGLLGAVAVAGGSHTGYRLIVGWSCRRALPGSQSADRAHTREPAARAHLGGYRAALADRALLLLTGTNLLFVLCTLAPEVLLTVYLVHGLHRQAWLSGVLFAANTAIVAAGQTVVTRAMQPVTPHRVLQTTAITWAASFMLLAALGTMPAPLVIPGAFVGLATFTAAEMIQGPTLNALILATAPARERGRYLAIYQFSWALGRAAAPSMLSWLFVIGAAWPWLALSAACAAVVPTLARFGHSINRR